MTDPILYLSMILGLGGVYVLIASFNDDDDDSNDDGDWCQILSNKNDRLGNLSMNWFLIVRATGFEPAT